MSAIELNARPSIDFDAKLAETIAVLQQAAVAPELGAANALGPIGVDQVCGGA